MIARSRAQLLPALIGCFADALRCFGRSVQGRMFRFA